jgi:L-amino acid N-acyltransferase YncA
VSDEPVIDNASRDDLPQILAIYNEVIRNSTAVYSEEEFTPARGAAWFDAKTAHGFPLIVARDVSGIAGSALSASFGHGRAIGTASSTACTCARTGAARVSDARWSPSSWGAPPLAPNTS